MRNNIWITTLLLAGFSNALKFDNLRVLGPQGVNLWKLDAQAKAYSKSTFKKDFGLNFEDSSQVPLHLGGKEQENSEYDFRAQWFRQPLDHFDKKSKHTFHQRYWVNSRHYIPRKGAPVIVLDGGETSGEVSIVHIPYIELKSLCV